MALRLDFSSDQTFSMGAFSAIPAIVLLMVHLASCTKVWLPRVDFALGKNWQPEGFPSSGQAIVFPSKLNAIVGLPSGILTFASIVFPQQGGFLFSEESLTINLAARPSSQLTVSVFKSPKREAYYSGSNWGTYDEAQDRVTRTVFSPATPHAERVPCQYETAMFAVDKAMPQPVDFEDHEMVEVGNIRIGTSVEGLENFRSFLSTDIGQLLFYNAEDTIIRQGKCSNGEKCPCQEERQMEAICAHVPCPQPHCLSPIQPSGHCCQLCGSVLRANITNNISGSFRLGSFTDKLKRKIASGDTDDAEVDYYVGIDRSNGANEVQLIIVDKGEYGERSTQLMDSLHHFFEKQFPSGYKFRHAGQPHTPLVAGQVLAFLIFTLAAIATFFCAVYLHYYDDRIVPRLRSTFRNRAFFNTPFVFARFDPRNENDGISVDVNFSSSAQDVPQEERESTCGDTQPSSFDNPMYEQRPKGKAIDPAVEAFDDVELLVK